MKETVYKELEILDKDMPIDLRQAVETVFTQASIVEEYKLDEIPIEYVQRLLDIAIKYPEWDDMTGKVLDILGLDIEFVHDGPLNIKDTAN
jgi:hypothetical protein|tara:strand:+ start:278 stop:550 length:273 start_codon:yes stop_codon:yes gene_type:complete